MQENLSILTVAGRNGTKDNVVRSYDGHIRGTTVTTPQSAALTAPLTLREPLPRTALSRAPFTKQLYKFPIYRFAE